MRSHLLNALLALCFSILIWCAVGAQMSTVDTAQIDFEVEVPPGLIVSYEGTPSSQGRLVLNDLISVTVRGPKEQVDRLSQARLRGRFALTALRPETIQRHLEAGFVLIDPKAWIAVSKPLEVIETHPGQLRLELQRVIEAERWVAPGEVLGSPAPGHRLGEVRVTPRRVVVRGPAQTLGRDPNRPYPTDPIDLAGAQETFTIERAVRCPDGVSAGQRVQVRVEILPEVVEREIEFPVQLLRTAPGSVRPTPGAGSLPLVPGPARDATVSMSGLPFRIEAVGGWLCKLKIAGPEKTLESLKNQLDRARLLGQFETNLPVAYVSDVELLGTSSPSKPIQDHLSIEVSGLPAGLEYLEKRTLTVRLVPLPQ